MEDSPRIPSHAKNEFIYREDEMHHRLTPEHYERYLLLSNDDQLIVAHLVTNGQSFENAVRIIVQNQYD